VRSDGTWFAKNSTRPSPVWGCFSPKPIPDAAKYQQRRMSVNLWKRQNFLNPQG